MMNMKENKNKRIYSFEEVKSMVAEFGYVIIEDSFKFYSKKFTVKDNRGYYYVMNGYNISDNKHPRAFGKENPFTVNNIRHYIKINEIKTTLLSDVYEGNTKPMLWQCECGKSFERSWAHFLQGFILCKDCAKRNRIKKRRTPLDMVYNKIGEMGYKLVDDISDISLSKTPFVIVDNDGYKYKIIWNDFKNGKHPLKFHHSNPYSIQNINNFFIRELKDEYECISTEYKNNMSPLDFIHKKCGEVFTSIWAYMLTLKNEPIRAYCRCPNCNTRKIESHHASALKQVFMHEHIDTIVEEKSCINPLTSYVMPTDIVNHRLKIAVEVQSSRHDLPEKKAKDKIKKDYWINKGYKFYDPDIRDYSILEMIQLFFPNIEKIPNYVDFNFSNCIDFDEVQKLLDNGYTIKEIASILNLNEHSVRWLSTSGKVQLSEDYKMKVWNIKAIIRLSKNGEFLKRYESLYSLKDDGFASGTIRRVLAGKQDFSYDSFWVYEDKYLSGDYVLPKIKEDIFMIPVAKYDMNDNYVCSYNTIYDAEKDSVSSRKEIRRVAKGDRKSSRNEKWKFL